ncbi:MAG: hypothetical protein BalsKO_09380 [Balneolaceae bacterium]
MMENIFQKLRETEHINQSQFNFLESIRTKEIVSVYYDLRFFLYLGILLFTSGLGYFVYQNIGSLGHILAMFLLSICIIFGFYYIYKFSKPYSNVRVLVELNYFDYLLLLVALLVITLFSYVQIYFDLVEQLLRWSSLIGASIFFFMAYRFDNRAILTMGILALSATLGLSVSPFDWINDEFSSVSNLYFTSIFIGISLLVIGQISIAKDVKSHFRNTYQQIGLLFYYSGMVAAMFDSNTFIFGLFLLISASIFSYQSWVKKEFLHFFYSNIAGYTAFTLLLFRILNEIDSGSIWLLIYYITITLIAYPIFLVSKKSHFQND